MNINKIWGTGTQNIRFSFTTNTNNAINDLLTDEDSLLDIIYEIVETSSVVNNDNKAYLDDMNPYNVNAIAIDENRVSYDITLFLDNIKLVYDGCEDYDLYSGDIDSVDVVKVTNILNKYFGKYCRIGGVNVSITPMDYHDIEIDLDISQFYDDYEPDY